MFSTKKYAPVKSFDGCVFCVVRAKRKKSEKCFDRYLDFPAPDVIFAENSCTMPYDSDTHKSKPVHCLQCGAPIYFGRQGKKFCCLQCKNKWHNERAYPNRSLPVGRILHILDANRCILVKLMNMGIRTMDLPTLIHLGFDPLYVTSFRKEGIRSVYTCFDVQYELTPSRIKRISFLGGGVMGEKMRPVSKLPFSSGDL